MGPLAAAKPDGFHLDEPHRDSSVRIVLGQVVQVLSDGSKLIALLFGDNHETTGTPRNRVRQARVKWS
jgi:hypothetical protein